MDWDYDTTKWEKILTWIFGIPVSIVLLFIGIIIMVAIIKWAFSIVF